MQQQRSRSPIADQDNNGVLVLKRIGIAFVGLCLLPLGLRAQTKSSAYSPPATRTSSFQRQKYVTSSFAAKKFTTQPFAAKKARVAPFVIGRRRYEMQSTITNRAGGFSVSRSQFGRRIRTTR